MGSSEKYSKLRPHSGDRFMFTPGPRTACTPSARASAPIAAATRCNRSRSQEAPIADAVGKPVAGTQTMSTPVSLRSPCGPSPTSIAGTGAGSPGRSIGWVNQSSTPDSSDAFSSRVRAARTSSTTKGGVCIEWGLSGTGRVKRREVTW